MEEVIKKIIQIEEQAQSIINETIKEKERKEKAHQEKIEKLQDEIISNAHKKVQQIRTREFEEINEKRRAMEEECQERLGRMESYGNQMMDQWVDALVNRVLS